MNHTGVLCRLIGGLGNQMCCYATARWLVERNGQPLILDHVSGFLKDTYARKPILENFNILGASASAGQTWRNPLVRAERWWHRTLQKYSAAARRSSYAFGKYTGPGELGRLLGRESVILEGVWIHHELFQEIRPYLLRELTYKGALSAASLVVQKDILAAGEHAVGLHLRSYLETANPAQNGTWQNVYLQKALQELNSRVDAPRLFVFTDDPDYARSRLEGLALSFPVNYVRHNLGRGDQGGLEDFELLRSCAHQVIDHSTFSWWAAWLNDREGKVVVAPAVWLTENKYSIPDDWIIPAG